MNGRVLRSMLPLALLLALLSAMQWGGPMRVRAGNFVVDSAADDADAHDVTPGDGACADDQGRCTLRAAIEESNAWPDADTITFAQPMTITISTAEGGLPDINQPITIDGSTTWDPATGPGVILDGNGGFFHGLGLYADSCQVYGLHITDFGLSAIYIWSSDNTIGGIGVGQGNVLSGSDDGVHFPLYTAQNNVVQNNYIGLDGTGQAANPNKYGVSILSGAQNNTIGGSTAAAGNVISGNDREGVQIEGAHDNRLGGNIIGLAADGTTPLGNGEEGVKIERDASDNEIGGAGLAPNIIAANGRDGVLVEGNATVGNTISSNSIYDNNWAGIRLTDGGNTELAAPIISSAGPTGASGTACASCTVEVFSDDADEGKTYHGSTVADAGGNWVYTGTLAGPFVTATATDAGGNTSAFSMPKTIPTTDEGTCATPLPLACSGQVDDTTLGRHSNLSSYSCAGASEFNGPESVYAFTLPAGNTYAVTATLSNLEGRPMHVFLLASDGCESGTCLAADSFGEARNVAPGTYYAVVDGWMGTVGDYTIGLTCTVEPVCDRPLTGVTIQGPTAGKKGKGYVFTATVAPPDPTPPISYTWSNDGLVSGQGMESATYRWDEAGEYQIGVAASNCGGSESDVRTIEIRAHVYLPLVLRE